ncbi:FadR/GntR family transcriptional regulator [Actinoplanes sp. NPDC089786]|uniref:FadR/GntR family transcriptional regulator n=1 Tax=Actinoplanes sp. NPDC089786 TaxID=3155185 RepID=UPI00343AE84D
MSAPINLSAVVPRSRGDRLGTAVVEALVDDIVSGRLRPGEALPTESEIGDHFGVSRTVVRESAKLLQDKGLVDIRRGVGTVVRSPAAWDMIDDVVLSALVRNDETQGVLDELVAVRASLERDMAEAAASLRTPDDLSEISDKLAAMESLTTDLAAFAFTDTQFHDVVMTASGNRLGRAIVTSIHDKARTTGRYQGTTTAAHIALTLDEHRAVLAALTAGDGDAAGRLMYEHITGSWSRRRPPT